MQVIIADGWFLRGRTVYLNGGRLGLAALLGTLGLGFLIALLLLSVMSWRQAHLPAGASGHHERLVRENIEVMARQVGELSAKLAQVEALAERVSSLAGVRPAATKAQGSGGPLVGLDTRQPDVLAETLAALDRRTDVQQDLMVVLESRLMDDRLRKMMLPTQWPVEGHAAGSVFGWRPDPINGQSALHTGLDFPAEVGTPIVAAAGGLVLAQEFHPAYGNLLELDHGNDVVTRYAHISRSFVKKGDLVKRGQRIAEVGNSGRSTGPHLHFEVLVRGAFQNPELFLKSRERPVALRSPS